MFHSRNLWATTPGKRLGPGIIQGSSQVMTRPAGPVRKFLESQGSGRVGSGGCQTITGRVGPVRVALNPTRPEPTRPARFDQNLGQPCK